MEQKAGIRFSQNHYILVNMENKTITEVKKGETINYTITPQAKKTTKSNK